MLLNSLNEDVFWKNFGVHDKFVLKVWGGSFRFHKVVYNVNNIVSACRTSVI